MAVFSAEETDSGNVIKQKNHPCGRSRAGGKGSSLR